MKTILITGMSGTGKSTLIAELLSRGYSAADLDTDVFSVWVDAEADPAYPDNEVKPRKDWVWHEERVAALLSSNSREVLFVSGCASNMSKFYSYFNHIILLTASDEVITERLQTRQEYGQSPEELARVLRLKATIEPLLRRLADLEIDTATPGQLTVEVILRHVSSSLSRE